MKKAPFGAIKCVTVNLLIFQTFIFFFCVVSVLLVYDLVDLLSVVFLQQSSQENGGIFQPPMH